MATKRNFAADRRCSRTPWRASSASVWPEALNVPRICYARDSAESPVVLDG
jgi:hypothetical protein